MFTEINNFGNHQNLSVSTNPVNEPAERSSFLRSSPHPGLNPVPPECHASALTTAPHSRLFRAAASPGAARLFPALRGAIRQFQLKIIKKAHIVAQCLRLQG